MEARRLLTLSLLLLVVTTAGCGAAGRTGEPDAAATQHRSPPAGSPHGRPSTGPEPGAAELFDRSARSTTDPRSIWVVVNKARPIAPLSYRPELAIVRGYQLAEAAAVHLTRLMDDSDRAGIGFKIASAFRSYDYQQRVHDNLVASQGGAAADRVSARPGHSEHQTGLAVDLVTPLDPGCDFKQCFAGTAAARWLAAHAGEYGFIVRYTAGNEAVTGYRPEPWHIRYVGTALAAAMRASRVTTLEEFLHVPGGDYR